MRKHYWLHLVLESVFRRASPPPFIVPFASRAHSNAKPERPPRGVTLFELLLAIALLGGMAALVAPSMIAREARGNDLSAVVRSARSAAIARAEPLVLRVTADGAWSLRVLPPDDASALGAGVVTTPTEVALTLQLSPLGACMPLAPLPQSLAQWDVASCTAASWRHPSRRGGSGA